MTVRAKPGEAATTKTMGVDKMQRYFRRATALAAVATLLAGVGFDGGARAQDASSAVVAAGDLGAGDWTPQLTVGTNRIVYDLVNETLIGVDADGNLAPRLAKAWEVSEDGKTWRITLQEGVQFHDDWGEMTTEDVKFTWGMFTGEDSLLSRAKVWGEAVGGDVEKNFEIVNDYEFVLHGDSANVLLPLVLTYPEDTMQIQSKRYWEEAGEEKARSHPIGTGPYRFVSENPAVEVKLEAVDNHWRHTPSIKNLTVRVVADDAARLAQVRAGEVDVAQIPPSLAEEAKAVGLDLVLAENAYMCNVILGGIYPFEELEEGFSNIHKPDLPWVQDDQPERGLAIRKAMSLAIDRELIAEALMSGMGKPVRATMQLAVIADKAMEPARYDPEEAKRLLAEGGYPDGFTFDMPIYKQTGREAGVDIAHAVAGMWEEHLGLKVNRMPMEFEPTFRAHMEQRTTGDPWPGSDGVGKVSVFCQPFRDEPATQLVTSIMPGGAFTQFHHEAAQELIPMILNNPDRAERNRMHAELGRRIAEDYTSFGVVGGAAPFVVSNRVANFPVLPGRGEFNNLEYLELK
jgi:peptide/nickel transport system substrate-binding protein